MLDYLWAVRTCRLEMRSPVALSRLSNAASRVRSLLACRSTVVSCVLTSRKRVSSGSTMLEISFRSKEAMFGNEELLCRRGRRTQRTCEQADAVLQRKQSQCRRTANAFMGRLQSKGCPHRHLAAFFGARRTSRHETPCAHVCAYALMMS
jgi:hypothetical protein